MADDRTTTDDDIEVIIPEETQTRFPALVAMIGDSKSMNNQERNYWLQVLPVMTEPQVAELQDILDSEKKKLAEIEKKYAKKPEKKELSSEELAELDKKKKQQRVERIKQEELAKKAEDPDDILSQLDFA